MAINVRVLLLGTRKALIAKHCGNASEARYFEFLISIEIVVSESLRNEKRQNSTENQGLLKTVLEDAKASSVRVYSRNAQTDLEILSAYYAASSARRQALKSQYGVLLNDASVGSSVSASSTTISSEVSELAAARLESKKLNKVIYIDLEFNSLDEFRNELAKLKALVKASDYKLHFSVFFKRILEEMGGEMFDNLKELRAEFDSLKNIKVIL